MVNTYLHPISYNNEEHNYYPISYNNLQIIVTVFFDIRNPVSFDGSMTQEIYYSYGSVALPNQSSALTHLLLRGIQTSP